MPTKQMVNSMSTHDLLGKLEKLEFFNDLITSGIVPVEWLDYKLMYEYYLDELKSVKSTQAICNTAEEFKVSERTVYTIVKKLRG